MIISSAIFTGFLAAVMLVIAIISLVIFVSWWRNLNWEGKLLGLAFYVTWIGVTLKLMGWL